MAELNVVLSTEEKDYLVGLLETALGETRVEVHRTHTPAYREQVLRQENLVRGLLTKLQQPQA